MLERQRHKVHLMPVVEIRALLQHTVTRRSTVLRLAGASRLALAVKFTGRAQP